MSDLEQMIRSIVREELVKILDERERASEWMSAYDAAQILHVHPKTLRKWIREGKLEASRAGKRHRVRRADIDRMLERGSTNENLTPEQMAERKYG